jgi:hypothetical protein
MKYKTTLAFLLLVIATSITAFGQFDKILGKAKKALNGGGKLSNEEIIQGLKEALTQGISKGADVVSMVDGYNKNLEIKIPFPADAKRVEDRLRQLGMGNDVDKFITTLNRGAEDAAKEAKPIFVNAIKQMSFDDALSILKGNPDAATQFLKRTTSIELKKKFSPVVQKSLDKVEATKYYGSLVGTYNKIPFVDKANPDLNAYATDKAIEGLFVMIAKEEKNIRDNPGARASDILKKVFGQK